MTVTQAQLNALVAAWATGSTRVSAEGRTVEYRSRQEMEAQIATIAAALGVPNPLAPSAPVTGIRYTRFLSGL